MEKDVEYRIGERSTQCMLDNSAEEPIITKVILACSPKMAALNYSDI